MTDAPTEQKRNNTIANLQLVKVNVNLQSSVQVWFNYNIVLVIKFLSKMLVWYKRIWRSWGALTDYECEFEGGMSGASGVCDNLIKELDVRSGNHFVENWLIWRQIVLFRQSGDHCSNRFCL